MPMDRARATQPPRASVAPTERRAIRSDRVVADEFVFHLHRGVELLEAGHSLEAKEALELALSERPKDPESQALLALVYFRLGLYPRAIELYRSLADSHPHTLSLKVNLAVCYLKTGQHALAEDVLIAVVGTDPSHTKAWAYLGLAHERLGEHGKAARAYELGGHTKQADRARALAEGRPDPLEANRVRDVASAFFDELAEERVEFRLAAPVQQEGQGTWTTLEPGRPATLDDLYAPEASLGSGSSEVAPPSLRPTRPPPQFASRKSTPPPDPVSIPVQRASTPPAPPPEPPAEPLAAPAIARTVSMARGGLHVWASSDARAPRLVRREGLFGYDASLQASALTRETTPGTLENWCRFHGQGRVVLAPRGRKQLLALGGSSKNGTFVIARAELLLAHTEEASDGREDLLWSDSTRVRMLRLRSDSEALLELAEGCLELPLLGREIALRREVFLAAQGALELTVHDDAQLGQRGLIRVKGSGTLFLLRP